MPKHKKNGNGKKKAGIVPVLIASRALASAGISSAVAHAKAGAYGEAIRSLGGVSETEMRTMMTDGLKLGIARKVVGRLPLITTKKFSLTVL